MFMLLTLVGCYVAIYGHATVLRRLRVYVVILWLHNSGQVVTALFCNTQFHACTIVQNQRQDQFEYPILFTNRGYVPMCLCSFVHLNCCQVDPQ